LIYSLDNKRKFWQYVNIEKPVYDSGAGKTKESLNFFCSL